jgi:hypothetical protein
MDFATGSLVGQYVSDDIRIGLHSDMDEDSPESIHIRDFKFGLIIEEKGIFDNFHIDAIIGMAFSGFSVNPKVPTIVDAMIAQKLLKNDIFAYYFVMEEDTKHGL